MGEASKKLKKLLAEGEEDGPLVKAVGLAEDVYGTMSGAYAAYGAAKGVLQQLGILGTPKDPLEEITELLVQIDGKLNEILGQLAEIKELIAAGEELIKLQHLTEPLTKSHTAFVNALAVIRDPTPSNVTLFYETEGDSWAAAKQLSLADMSFWWRLTADDAMYSDAWTGLTKPDPDNAPPHSIWDWRALLPRYLQVLEWHTFVFLAGVQLDPAYRKDRIGEMAKLGEFLLTVYQKMLAGFLSIRRPGAEEMKYVIATLDDANFYYYRKQGDHEEFHEWDFLDPKDGRPVKKMKLLYAVDWLLANRIPGGRWRVAGYRYGAVERYSGFDVDCSYPLHELETARPLIAAKPGTWDYDSNSFADVWWHAWKVTVVDAVKFQRFYERFLVRHSLRNAREVKRLYRELGLPKLYSTIRHYHSLLGLPVPEALIQDHARFTEPSVAEAFEALASSGVADAVGAFVSSVVGDASGALTSSTDSGSEPRSLRRLAAILQPGLAKPSASVSVRQLLLLDEATVHPG